MKKLICAIFAATLFIPTVSSYYDVNKINDISVYKNRLEELNEKYGTDYVIPDEDITGKDTAAFYTSMTLEEFDKYIAAINDGTIYNSDDKSIVIKEPLEGTIPANSDELNDISVYEQHLKKFNKEHETNYFIPEDNNVKNIFVLMTLEEFDKYVLSVYNGTYYDVEKANVRYDGVYLGFSGEI